MEMNQMEMTTEEFLEHYGVLGMKWGVRKERKKVGVLNRLKSSSSSKTTSAKKAPKKKATTNAKKMTDAELKKKIDRLLLEKQYKDLKASQVSEGKKLAFSILKKSGANVGEQFVTYIMGTAVNWALKDVTNDSKVVNPKKGQYPKK